MKPNNPPKKITRQDIFDALVLDFEEAGFTESQAAFLINLLDQYLPIIQP